MNSFSVNNKLKCRRMSSVGASSSSASSAASTWSSQQPWGVCRRGGRRRRRHVMGAPTHANHVHNNGPHFANVGIVVATRSSSSNQQGPPHAGTALFPHTPHNKSNLQQQQQQQHSHHRSRVSRSSLPRSTNGISSKEGCRLFCCGSRRPREPNCAQYDRSAVHRTRRVARGVLGVGVLDGRAWRRDATHAKWTEHDRVEVLRRKVPAHARRLGTRIRQVQGKPGIPKGEPKHEPGRISVHLFHGVRSPHVGASARRRLPRPRRGVRRARCTVGKRRRRTTPCAAGEHGRRAGIRRMVDGAKRSQAREFR
mmetsp:Transcript_8683/g.23290  ORF Transcript_8683/g.23290 Transcript_8683/m.23290 type:complete len:310 (+) Transcript_8683:72-1001(+)